MSDRSMRGSALAVVQQQAPKVTEPTVSFCSHCGQRPSGLSDASRVCRSCGLGLLLESSAGAAPAPGDPFLVLNTALSVCAVSATAERLLATTEADAVNRHITELIVPADTEAQGAVSLAAAVTWAARGDEARHEVFVRPTNTFGVRLAARIAGCGPARAALVVFA